MTCDGNYVSFEKMPAARGSGLAAGAGRLMKDSTATIPWRPGRRGDAHGRLVSRGRDRRRLLDGFFPGGRLNGFRGAGHLGAVCASASLEPGEEAEIPIVLAWYFSQPDRRYG